MLLGDLLLACLIFWISIMRAESSEYGGDRERALRVGSEACDVQLTRHHFVSKSTLRWF